MSKPFNSLEEMLQRYTFIKSEAFDFPLCEDFFDRLTLTLQTHELRERVDWKKYIRLELLSYGKEMIVCNGVSIGEIGKLEDNYFYFYPYKRGAVNSFKLELIAKLLDDKNKEWDEQIKKDLKGE